MEKLHVIWDLDGTLIDSRYEIQDVLDKSIKEIGLADIKTVSDFRSGPPLDKVLDNMYGGRISDAQKSLIISAFRKNYDNCGFKHTLSFDNIEEILKDSHFVHHIVTNKPDLATSRILEKLNWKKYFSSVVTPYSYRKSQEDKRKSKTELFSLCIADYPTQSFVGVGDMDTDVKAALENKIPAIGVLWGTGTRDEFEKCECTYIVESRDELKTILGSFI